MAAQETKALPNRLIAGPTSRQGFTRNQAGSVAQSVLSSINLTPCRGDGEIALSIQPNIDSDTGAGDASNAAVSLQANPTALWPQVLTELSSQLSDATLATWLRPLRCDGVHGTQLVLLAPSDYHAQWVAKQYRSAILTAVTRMTNQPVHQIRVERCPEGLAVVPDAPAQPLLFETSVTAGVPRPLQVVSSSAPQATPGLQTSPGHPKRPSKRMGNRLNPKFTFDSWVQTAENRMATAAAKTVADQPGQAYPVLVVHGASGSGKTHLLHAMAQQLLAQQPDAALAFVSAEHFTNELMSALANKQWQAFRDRYRQLDVLLLDDIAFLAGKTRTQQEFIYTLNALHEQGAQVVITTAQPLAQLSGLEAGLVSRLAAGLCVQIQGFGPEATETVLRTKAQALALPLPPAVLSHMLTTLSGTTAAGSLTDLRQVDHVLMQWQAYLQLAGISPTAALTPAVQAEFLALQSHLRPERKRERSASDQAAVLLDCVAGYFHLDPADITGPLRTKPIAHARQVAAYLLRELTAMSFPQIASTLGRKHHGTICHACDKIRSMALQQPALAAQLDALRQRIEQALA